MRKGCGEMETRLCKAEISRTAGGPDVSCSDDQGRAVGRLVYCHRTGEDIMTSTSRETWSTGLGKNRRRSPPRSVHNENAD